MLALRRAVSRVFGAANREKRPTLNLIAVGLPPGPDRIFYVLLTAKLEGTGASVAISRSIIESHGGRLWAAFNAGHGAAFDFTLPTTIEDQP